MLFSRSQKDVGDGLVDAVRNATQLQTTINQLQDGRKEALLALSSQILVNTQAAINSSSEVLILTGVQPESIFGNGGVPPEFVVKPPTSNPF
jgi:hypothetical protein